MARPAKPIRARVTKADIADGKPGDCLKCAVALALNRATGDGEAMVVERDWAMCVKVWSRYIVAPYEVRRFVYHFDGWPRTEDGRLDMAVETCEEPPKPFGFTLPSQDSPEWEEECRGCETLFGPSELDGEGYCEDCRNDEAAEDAASYTQECEHG